MFINGSRLCRRINHRPNAGVEILIKLESPDASSGFEATSVYQAQLIIDSESGTTAARYANDLRVKPVHVEGLRRRPNIQRDRISI